jgi:PD-(D/E)XK nuclease superfamily
MISAIATTATADPVQVPSPAQSPPKVSPVETLRKTVSASRLNCFLSRRLKFFFRYVQEIKKPPTPSLHVGSVVHLILKAWNMSRWKRQAFELARFKMMFEVCWADQPATINWKDDEAGEKSGAWALLEAYFTETPIKANDIPEAVEVPVETDLSEHGLPTLIGILDLVRAGGRIVDFKTAGKTPSAEDAMHLNEIQLSCYSVLYREATGNHETARELHHLVKTKTPKIIITSLEPMSDLQQVRLFRVMDSYQEGLAREDWVPSPGIQCAACEFFNECRRFC